MKNNQKQIDRIKSYMKQFEINEEDTEKIKEEKINALNKTFGINPTFEITLKERLKKLASI